MTEVVQIEDQHRAVAFHAQAGGKASGNDVLVTHEHLQRFLQIAAGLLQVADHIQRARAHHLAEVQADIGVAAQRRQSLQEVRRHVVRTPLLTVRRRQGQVRVGLPVDLHRVQTEAFQTLVKQPAQHAGMSQTGDVVEHGGFLMN